jgi:tetratricopeptide (TPR) repeat protein
MNSRHLHLVLLLPLLALGAPPASAGEKPAPPTPSLEEMRTFSEMLKGGAPQSVPRVPVRPRGPHARADPHYRLSPEKLVKVALQHLAEGRPAEAMKTLDAAIARYPEHYQLRGVRASLHLQHRRYAKALADLEVALKSRPDDPLLLVNRAQAYRGFRRDEEALADLNHALRIRPDFIGALFNRGALLFEKKRYREALRDFEKVAELDPHLPAARFNIAVTYEALGERGKAMKELRDFLRIARHKGWVAVALKQLNNWRKMEGQPPLKLEEVAPQLAAGMAAKAAAANGGADGAPGPSGTEKEKRP